MTRPDHDCPDDARCWHGCSAANRCWRVEHAGPLSMSALGLLDPDHSIADRWPQEVLDEHLPTDGHL